MCMHLVPESPHSPLWASLSSAFSLEYSWELCCPCSECLVKLSDRRMPCSAKRLDQKISMILEMTIRDAQFRDSSCIDSTDLCSSSTCATSSNAWISSLRAKLKPFVT